MNRELVFQKRLRQIKFLLAGIAIIAKTSRFLKMQFEDQGIKCGIFGDAEKVIKKAEDRIRDERNLKEREYYAEDILVEAKSLLSCLNYNAKNPDCINCQSILLKFIQEYEHLAKNGSNRNSIAQRESYRTPKYHKRLVAKLWS